MLILCCHWFSRYQIVVILEMIMIDIFPIPAFKDNYIWLLSKGQHAVIVDPGDASVVIRALEQRQLTLEAILITHHHADHIDGVDELVAYQPCPVYAPRREHYTFAHQPVQEGNIVELPALGIEFQVLEVPGHTRGHIAYYTEGLLFCGDTLFGAGCGRLFEGTPAQMHASLQRLAKLPVHTKVYCTHEYTEHNIGFALRIEPDNVALRQRQAEARALRSQGLPTLPSTIQLELETNPFLRCDQPAVQRAANFSPTQAEAVFAAIRELRNHY
jgi:hydroxyacylglutathione hydrolase